MSPLPMLSPSAATDAAWLAAADVASIAADLGVRYRLVGGIAITLLTYHYGVDARVPARETADADMGVPRDVCGDERLPAALLDRTYKQEGGNRFFRTDDAGRELTIDVLAPAAGTRLEVNQEIGELSVDLIPGLLAALLLPPVEVDVVAHLTDGTELSMTLALPDLRGALILKVFAYRGRFQSRDASDVWRLLESALDAGLTVEDWPDSPTGREAAHLLHQYFAAPNAAGARAASARTSDQARLRLLVRRLVPAVTT